MDEPITDVVFVASEKDCPEGYKILTECPDEHSANLWQKFLGGKTEIRYICFTKEDKDGKVVEDMYIPGKNERYVMKGYEVIKRTVTGEESLNLRYLAIKKTPRSKAKRAVMDITVFRSKDKPAAVFKKLGAKINGLYICIRLDDLKNKATIANSKTESLSPACSTPAGADGSGSTLQTAPSSSSPPQTAPLNSSPQPSPLPSSPTQSKPLSSSPPSTYSAPISQTPPPVASELDSSAYPVKPPTTSTSEPAQFTPTPIPVCRTDFLPSVPDTSAHITVPAPLETTPSDPTSYGSDLVGSHSDVDSGAIASEVNTVALGFELLDLDQPIPESFQQLDDSPPESDDESTSPERFTPPVPVHDAVQSPPTDYSFPSTQQPGPEQLSTPYSQGPMVTRSHTIAHGSSPTSVSHVQQRSGSMRSSYPHPATGQGYHPPTGGQGYPPHPGSQGYPPQSGSQGYPPQPGSQGYPPQHGSRGYPPQPGSLGYPPQPGSLGYPPQSGSQGYPPQPGSLGYPPQPGSQGYPPQAGQGYPPPPSYTNFSRPMSGGYPAPAGFTGYNAGPSFRAAPINPASSGPRPFNPYEQGHPASYGSQPGYPPAYPPSTTSYGFKF